MKIVQLKTRIDRARAVRLTALSLKGQPIGCSTVKLEKFSAFISAVYVAPRYRGKGVAAALIRECRIIAQKAGCETASMNVAKGNQRAFLCYRRLGFLVSYHWDDGDVIMTIGTRAIPACPRSLKSSK